MSERQSTPSLWERARRKAWMKLTLKDVSGNDNHSQLDRIYTVADPWGMETAREQARFAATNAIIESAFGRVGSVLEIGCGEGHQTEWLARLSDEQYGVDVSAKAIERARKRLPQASFHAGSIEDQPWGDAAGRFDLVTACDVLYYMSDVPAAIARMRHLAPNGLVTFYAPTCDRVAPHLMGIPNIRHDWIAHQRTSWLVAWWRND